MSDRTTPNLDRWMAVYTPSLEQAVRANPSAYMFSAEVIAPKMRAAFERGSYSHDGPAVKAACKALRLKYTRRSIEAFLTGAE